MRNSRGFRQGTGLRPGSLATQGSIRRNVRVFAFLSSRDCRLAKERDQDAFEIARENDSGGCRSFTSPPSVPVQRVYITHVGGLISQSRHPVDVYKLAGRGHHSVAATAEPQTVVDPMVRQISVMASLFMVCFLL